MPAARTDALMALQEHLWRRYSRPLGDPVRSLALLYRVNGRPVLYVTSHYDFTGFFLPWREPRNLCFRYNGIAFASVETPLVDDNQPLNIGRPSLLLYDETRRLTGCGFVRRATGDPEVFGRPLSGVSRNEWFLHPAGWHTITGEFMPSEDGSWRCPLLRRLHTSFTRVAPGMVGFVNGSPAAWHHAYWDLHIFFDLDDQGRSLGTPVVARTTRAVDIGSPPNPPHGELGRIIDRVFCRNGASTDHMNEDPTDHHH